MVQLRATMMSFLLLVASAAAAEPDAKPAAETVGTFTQVQGEVRLLPRPKTEGGEEEHLKLPGVAADLNRYYTGGRDAEPGMVIENGAVIVTKENARARIVYPNGDQLVLAPKTVFRLSWQAEKPTLLELARGALKAWITKGGPRSDLKVHTNSMVMGVRGTEFAVSIDGKAQSTSLTVLRGKVGLKSVHDAANAVEVARGETAVAKVAAKSPADAPRQIAVATTTKAELRALHAETTITAKPKTPLPTAVAAKVKALESTAAVAVVRDIQAAEPEILASMKGATGSTNLEEILEAAEKAREHHAPRVAAPVKAARVDMPDEADDELESDADVQGAAPVPPPPQEPQESGTRYDLFAGGAALLSNSLHGNLFGMAGMDVMPGPHLGLHVELGNLVASETPNPSPGNPIVQLDFFGEAALAWRPWTTPGTALQLTFGGGYASYNQYDWNGAHQMTGGPRSANYNAGLLSFTLSERVLFSQRLGLLATFADRKVMGTTDGSPVAVLLELGAFFSI